MTTRDYTPGDSQAKGSHGFRLSGELSLGSILQSIVVIIASVGLYILNTSTKTDNTAAHLTQVEATMGQMKADLIDKISSYQIDNNRRFDELSHQVSGLPDQTANLRILDQRVSRLEASKVDRDKEISALHDLVLGDHAEITAIEQANRPKLGHN